MARVLLVKRRWLPPLAQVYPDSIHLTAVKVEYETPTKRINHGVATGWLALKKPDNGTQPQLPIFVRRSQFKLPSRPQVPIVMVGPGTGLAPFRGFIQERDFLRKEGGWRCQGDAWMMPAVLDDYGAVRVGRLSNLIALQTLKKELWFQMLYLILNILQRYCIFEDLWCHLLLGHNVWPVAQQSHFSYFDAIRIFEAYPGIVPKP